MMLHPSHVSSKQNHHFPVVSHLSSRGGMKMFPLLQIIVGVFDADLRFWGEEWILSAAYMPLFEATHQRFAVDFLILSCNEI
jgi:hypothetical protein